MFSGMNSGVSLADIAAVTDRNGNGGFGDGNGWWVLIILFALFGGWGNGGYGYGNQGNGVGAEVQRGFDTAAITGKLNGLESGLCSLGYDQLAQINGINTNILQTGFGLQQAINADTVANMQNTNNLSRQLAECCCENRTGQMQIINQMDKNACALGNQLNQMAQAIMQNDNANFRALNDQVRDGFTALAMAQKDAEISTLRQALNDCNRDKALQGTASYVINAIRPPAVPAYPAANPNGMGNWSEDVISRGNYGGCCNNFRNGCY